MSETDEIRALIHRWAEAVITATSTRCWRIMPRTS